MIMKDTILNKIFSTLIRLDMYNRTAVEVYKEIAASDGWRFNDLCAIYNLTEEEKDFVWNDQTA